MRLEITEKDSAYSIGEYLAEQGLQEECIATVVQRARPVIERLRAGERRPLARDLTVQVRSMAVRIVPARRRRSWWRELLNRS